MRSSRIQVPAPLAIDLLLHYSTQLLYVIDSTRAAFMWKIQRIDTQNRTVFHAFAVRGTPYLATRHTLKLSPATNTVQ